MEVYKVVGANTRCSTNNVLHNNEREPREYAKNITRFYKKGEFVCAIPGSMGIFCFLYKKDAKSFIREYFSPKETLILKVRGIGEPKEPAGAHWADELYHGFTKAIDLFGMCTNLPKGTICFDVVEVLE